MKVYTSELLNFSVEIMNSIVEDIIDLLQDKSNLSSPYRSVSLISSSCFFGMLSSVFLIIERDCLADWKRAVEEEMGCDHSLDHSHMLGGGKRRKYWLYCTRWSFVNKLITNVPNIYCLLIHYLLSEARKQENINLYFWLLINW